jgi:hypothetical protein
LTLPCGEFSGNGWFAKRELAVNLIIEMEKSLNENAAAGARRSRRFTVRMVLDAW